MHEQEYNRLQDNILRGQLTTAEQERLEALLARHPELVNLSNDLALNQILEQMPDAPISSNFTSQVLKAVELEAAAVNRTEPGFGRFWSFSWARSAMAAVAVLAAALLTLHAYNEKRERAVVATSVTRITEVTTTFPSVELLKDFEAISRLGQMSTVDYELLAMQ
jgi:anti-sigma factor RsiW